jgi:hypothetical protein
VRDEHVSAEHLQQLVAQRLERRGVLHHSPRDVREPSDKRRNGAAWIDKRLEHVDDLSLTNHDCGNLGDAVAVQRASTGRLDVDDDVGKGIEASRCARIQTWGRLKPPQPRRIATDCRNFREERRGHVLGNRRRHP